MRDLNRLTPAERFTYYSGLWLNDDEEEPQQDENESGVLLRLLRKIG